MLRTHSHFSLLKAYGTPEDIVNKAVSMGLSSCSLTDYNSVSGCIDFYTACKKKSIKPILGCDFSEFTLLCKNLEGWKELLAILSSDRDFSASPNLIALKHSRIDSVLPEWSGSPNLYHCVTGDPVRSDEIFSPPSYYLEDSDKEILEILISIALKKSIPDIKRAIKSSEIDPEMTEYYKFFSNESFSFNCHESEEKICDQIEEFSILSEPKLPNFPCEDENKYLRDICLAKLRELGKDELYLKRLEHELDVIKKANLAGYFLIVRDFINFAKERGALMGISRGSAGGSLVSYLSGIIGLDPIFHELIFERFYDASRSYPKHLSFDEYKFVDDFRSKA